MSGAFYPLDGTQPLKVLCIDGGGVLGLNSLLVLRILMQDLQRKSGAHSMPRPCDVFDLIAGASTGGLIALMLGRLHMDVDAAIDAYIDISRRTFGNRSRALFSWCIGRPRYSVLTLEKSFKKVVADNSQGDARAGGLRDPLVCVDSPQCRTLVVSFPQFFLYARPQLFRTYKVPLEYDDVGNIWEAARATTAATGIFAPSRYMIYGAFGGETNPSVLALQETWKIFPDRKIGCFVSLGTGVPSGVRVRGINAKVLKACGSMLMSCQRVDWSVAGYFAAHYPLKAYFRFSVIGPRSMTLDEWNQVRVCKHEAEIYMQSWQTKRKAETCVSLLHQRAGRLATDSAVTLV